MILQRHQAVTNGRGYVGHFGTDFRVDRSQSVISVADGIVAYVEEKGTGGGGVTILHAFPSDPRAIIMVTYFHLSNLHVKAGDNVSRGDVIGDAWLSADKSWVPHVHLTIGGFGTVTTRDPLRFLAGCASETQAPAPIFPVSC